LKQHWEYIIGGQPESVTLQQVEIYQQMLLNVARRRSDLATAMWSELTDAEVAKGYHRMMLTKKYSQSSLYQKRRCYLANTRKLIQHF